MHPLTEPHGMSDADAAARLRYVSAVRTRARRAGLVPAFALVALGTVVLAHGLLRSLSPHGAIVSIAFVAALVLVRPAVARQRRRSAERRGLIGSTRLRIACGAVGALAAALAIVAGGDPLISGVVASAAVAAYLAGMPGLAAASVIAGAIANAVFLRGIDPAADEVLVGAVLIAAGLACQALERRER